MKTKIFKTAILSVAIGTMALTMGHDAFAQRGMGMGMGMGTGRPMQRMNNQNERPYMGQFIPNLSEEQQAKMDELRTKHLKEVTPLRNELNEKRARLQTLESAEKIDINAINKTIDEIAQLRANIMKKGAAHRAEVSSIPPTTNVQFSTHAGVDEWEKEEWVTVVEWGIVLTCSKH